MKALVTALIALALAAPAQASRYDPYLRVVVPHFPTLKCAPTVHGATSSEWAKWREEGRWTAEGFDPLAFADTDHCTVELAPSARRWTRQERCEAIGHEVGHLAGLGHSRSSRSIMYPMPTYRWKPCLRFRRRGIVDG